MPRACIGLLLAAWAREGGTVECRSRTGRGTAGAQLLLAFQAEASAGGMT